MDIYPRLVIDLNKIEQNTKMIVNLASKHNIQITGVTKCCCGAYQVANAMLNGGAVSIADSRIKNLKQLKEAGIRTNLMLLRTPMLSEVNQVVRYANISLNSEISVIEQLSLEAEKIDEIHKIVIMVEMGDLREGVPQDQLENFIEQAMNFKGIQLFGLGMNLACYGGIVPTPEKIQEFSEIVSDIEEKYNLEFRIISGGNSANIPLLLDNGEPTRINNLRIGEGILLGLETVNRNPIPNTFQDAFILEAEIIEYNEKPSIPDGTISQNAFGEKPRFEDEGIMIRGIIALGRQDVKIDGLKPMDINLKILGSSSDHIIFQSGSNEYKVGDIVKFQMDYGALLSVYTSHYVDKIYLFKK
jgi:predicted amino acid racemase